jgi:outer membrane protein TolC
MRNSKSDCSPGARLDGEMNAMDRERRAGAQHLHTAGDAPAELSPFATPVLRYSEEPGFRASDPALHGFLAISCFSNNIFRDEVVGLISRITGVSPVSSFKEDTGETPVIREIHRARLFWMRPAAVLRRTSEPAFYARFAIGIRITVRIAAVALLALLAGCTVHPPGEQAERRAASRAGTSFEKPLVHRAIPPLPENPSADDLVDRALRVNPGLEQKYWEWRSAIEQIPQDGTQPTNLVLSASLNITRGATGLSQMTAGAGNDPMADIVLPAKLSTAARRALENARAAGLRFRKAQFDARRKVLDAYADYALTAEMIRLQQSTSGLLKTTAMLAEARNQAGAASQADLLKAQNELDLSNNDLAAMQAQLPGQLAAINALLDRAPDAPLVPPAQIPPPRKIAFTDGQLLAFAAEENPELAAMAREIAGKNEGLALAKLQYLPDISIGASTDLKGVAQSLLGMVTVPWLRHEAIDAAVAQAQANLRADEAMHRQTRDDLAAQVVLDITFIRDADRQLDLFDQTILPRQMQTITLARSAYESGRAPLLDLLDSQRSLISLQRLIAALRVFREKRVNDLEAIAGRNVGEN